MTINIKGVMGCEEKKRAFTQCLGGMIPILKMKATEAVTIVVFLLLMIKDSA